MVTVARKAPLEFEVVVPSDTGLLRKVMDSDLEDAKPLPETVTR
jgi:hypothetical protein